MKMSKGVQIIILLSALVVIFIFSLDLRNDYYYHITKKETNATIKEIKKIEENKPYLIIVNYFNEYINAQSECSLKVDGRFGREISERSVKSIAVEYTKKDPCSFYITDYKHPNIGSFIIHAFIFLVAVMGAILFIKNLISK
jgi:hypothetical protein